MINLDFGSLYIGFIGYSFYAIFLGIVFVVGVSSYNLKKQNNSNHSITNKTKAFIYILLILYIIVIIYLFSGIMYRLIPGFNLTSGSLILLTSTIFIFLWVLSSILIPIFKFSRFQNSKFNNINILLNIFFGMLVLIDTWLWFWPSFIFPSIITIIAVILSLLYFMKLKHGYYLNE